MLLPGPEAHQLSVYVGWLLHRTRGGIVAGTLFVLPGLICLGVLSWIYAVFGTIGTVQALFFGQRRRCWPSSSKPSCGLAGVP